MVMSFKQNLEKREIKPNIKIKINEYKKVLKNNMFLSDWIQSCITNEDFVNYHLENLSIKETSLFLKHIKKSQTDFLIECRSFYKENPIPEFFKIYADNNCVTEFFENYFNELINKTQKNANIAKLIISEMLKEIQDADNDNFEIITENNDSFLPINNFKIKNEQVEFNLSLDKKNKKIIISNCNIEKYNHFIENRNKDKSLVNFYVKADSVNDLDQIKKNMLFLKYTYLENEKLNIRYVKNGIQVKCFKNQVAFDDKYAYPIFENRFQIFDLLRK